jgi:D-methionine transport system substrate-binding protein
VSAKADLVPIGATAIYQLGLYTAKGYKSPTDIPNGGEIAIPNDPTNQGRALLELQSAKLITLKNGGNALSTPAEIVAGTSRVKVVPVDANQTTVQLKSLDAAIINNNFASDAGINPTTAIYSDLKDTKAAAPYINVWVVPAKDNPVYAQLVKIYHEAAVINGLLAESKGTAVAQNQTPAELQTILTGLESDIKAAKV